MRVILAAVFCFPLLARGQAGGDVRAVFQKHCQECHSGDGEEPLLTGAMDLKSLASAACVVPGNADESELVRRVGMAPHEKRRMPYSKGMPGEKNYRAPLSQAEVDLIRNWVDGLGGAAGGTREEPASIAEVPDSPSATSERTFIDEAAVRRIVTNDLRELPPADRKSVRYLSFANLHNNRSVLPKQLSGFRKAISKLLNSVSQNVQIVRPVPVDENQVVYRFDLRDYRLDPSLWQTMLRHYPYGTESKSGDDSAGYILRADWFNFVLSQPPLYYEALGIPGPNVFSSISSANLTEGGLDYRLEQLLGLDTAANAVSGKMIRMAFEKSAVSQGNRAIERHDISTGYYWKSFDFNRDTRNANRLNSGDLFTAPLGPPDYGLTTNPQLQFRHDGGEIIYSLPNGMQAYMLVAANGSRLNKGPSNVVQDQNHPRGTIINGISCIKCHADGLISPARAVGNEVATASLLRDGFTAAERERLNAIYVDRKVVEKEIEADSRLFSEALKECGADDAAEPVWALYSHYAFRGIDSESLPAELGIPKSMVPGVFRDQAAHQAFIRMKAAALPREEFESVFAVFAAEAGLSPLPSEVLFVTEFADALKSAQRAENRALRVQVAPASRFTEQKSGGDDSPVKKLLDENAVQEQVRGMRAIRARQRQIIPSPEDKKKQQNPGQAE